MIDEVLRSTQDAIEGAPQYDRIFMTSAFGLSGMVLIHILREMGREVPILFVDTGFMFDETLFLRGKAAVMGVEVVTFIPQTYPVPCDVLRMGRCESPNKDRITTCCKARKVEPMRRALDLLKPGAILTARGRFQSITRQGLPFFECHRSPPRINPMVMWGQEQIEQYVKDHDVPHNPLHDKGYHSVGCWPCTRPVKEGEDVRAGRWDGLGKVECGIWE